MVNFVSRGVFPAARSDMSVLDDENLTPALEDYLEAILVQVRRSRVARVRDVARRLDVGMPSVSAAIKLLRKRRLVDHDPYEFITLTSRGRRLAEKIVERHQILRDFLANVLAIGADAADRNACRMEHAVDGVVVERLVKLGEFLRTCPREVRTWLDRADQPDADRRDRQACSRCALQAVDEAGELEDGSDGR